MLLYPPLLCHRVLSCALAAAGGPTPSARATCRTAQRCRWMTCACAALLPCASSLPCVLRPHPSGATLLCRVCVGRVWGMGTACVGRIATLWSVETGPDNCSVVRHFASGRELCVLHDAASTTPTFMAVPRWVWLQGACCPVHAVLSVFWWGGEAVPVCYRTLCLRHRQAGLPVP